MKHSCYRTRWSQKSNQRNCSCLLALLILCSPSLQSVPQLHEVLNLIAFFKSLLLWVLSLFEVLQFCTDQDYWSRHLPGPWISLFSLPMAHFSDSWFSGMRSLKVTRGQSQLPINQIHDSMRS